jgi:hypothetical protein
MAEVLFVLLTVYVVYVVQSVVYKKDEKQENSPTIKPQVAVETAKSELKKVVVEQVKPAVKKPVAKKIAPAKAKVAPKAKTTKKTKSALKEKVASGSLRNPATGDVDKIASSYRMTKRWIKDALVAEGLLPKIYKTAELDDVAKQKITKALDKLVKMDKYQ